MEGMKGPVRKAVGPVASVSKILGDKGLHVADINHKRKENCRADIIHRAVIINGSLNTEKTSTHGWLSHPHLKNTNASDYHLLFATQRTLC